MLDEKKLIDFLNQSDLHHVLYTLFYKIIRGDLSKQKLIDLIDIIQIPPVPLSYFQFTKELRQGLETGRFLMEGWVQYE